jgi:hypothetical protein
LVVLSGQALQQQPMEVWAQVQELVPQQALY